MLTFNGSPTWVFGPQRAIFDLILLSISSGELGQQWQAFSTGSFDYVDKLRIVLRRDHCGWLVAHLQRLVPVSSCARGMSGQDHLTQCC